FEGLHKVAAQKTGAPGYQHFFGMPKTHARLDVGEFSLQIYHGAGFNELVDALIDVNRSAEPVLANFLVRDLVVSLVLVLAYLGKVEIEGDLCLDLLRYLLLAEVHGLRSNVENLVLHLLEIIYGKGKRPGHVANMDKRSLELFLVEDQAFFAQRSIHKVIDQQIQAHAR